MIAVPPVETIPLQSDEQGVIRIAATRVTLDSVLARFQQGDSPEQIQRGFPTLQLQHIYAVIGYYLNHQTAVDAYLHDQAAQVAQTRRDLEALQPELFSLEHELRARIAGSQPDKA